jgi:hypothetical protein
MGIKQEMANVTLQNLKKAVIAHFQTTLEGLEEGEFTLHPDGISAGRWGVPVADIFSILDESGRSEEANQLSEYIEGMFKAFQQILDKASSEVKA